MKPDIPHILEGHDPIQGAYVFFSQGKGQGNSIYYNQEAWRIFSYTAFDEKGLLQKDAFPDIEALCLKWQKLLDEKINTEKKEEDKGVSSVIDIYRSWRKRYLVHGVLLASHGPDSNVPPPLHLQYLFTLDRVISGRINLPMIARQWRLSPREAGIVQYLVLDQSNKEMAVSLKISINTLKGYLKLLMRKLGVSSRAGIVARVLTGKDLPEEGPV